MAIIGLGTGITVTDGASNAAQAFGFVKEITIPSADLQYVDVSYLGQGNSYRQYIAGMIEPGDMAFTLQYSKVDLARVYALRGNVKSWVVTFPDLSTVAFQGILQKGESFPLLLRQWFFTHGSLDLLPAHLRCGGRLLDGACGTSCCWRG